jgi:hypothetical protein
VSPAVILSPLNGGIDTYTDPTQAPYNRWATAINVLTGAFGFLQRCRFANVVRPNPVTGQAFTSLKFFALPGLSSYLIADINGKLYSYDTGSSYAQTQRLNPYVDPAGNGSSQLDGPWSREFLENILYEMNGQVKQAGRLANAATIEGWGLDAPDVTPQIAINSGASQTITSIVRLNGVVTATMSAPFSVPTVAGTQGIVNIVGVTDPSFDGSFALTSGPAPTTSLTWNQPGQNVTSSGGSANYEITKAVGRSYAYAWENANKSHVGAPSPASQYILYNSQYGFIELLESGEINSSTGSPIVTGGGTAFTSAWVGRSIWATFASSAGVLGRVLSVQSPTQLTLAANGAFNTTSGVFQVFDPQATHIRLYATADGGATYFRIARNAWVPTATSLAGSGLNFIDTANSEPPNFPFTTETSQVNNLPPPVGSFVRMYQGVLCVFGITGEEQSLFF